MEKKTADWAHAFGLYLPTGVSNDSSFTNIIAQKGNNFKTDDLSTLKKMQGFYQTVYHNSLHQFDLGDIGRG